MAMKMAAMAIRRVVLSVFFIFSLLSAGNYRKDTTFFPSCQVLSYKFYMFIPERQKQGPPAKVPEVGASMGVYEDFFFVSMLLPKTKKRWYRNSVTKFTIMFRAVTRYSFQPRSSASQFPTMVLKGVNTA